MRGARAAAAGVRDSGVDRLDQVRRLFTATVLHELIAGWVGAESECVQ
jgi:hypothetical protein